MSAWSLYFLAKVALYYGHAIGLHWAWNAAFAVALAWPLRTRSLRIARHVAAIPVAIALLYYDSYLPPWNRVVDQIDVLSNFRIDYLWELLQRFVSPVWVAIVVAMIAVYVFLAHRVRFATIAFLALAVAAVVPAGSVAPASAPDPAEFVRRGEPVPPQGPGPVLAKPELDAALENAYNAGRGKIVSFSLAGTPAFDLVFLSVCSLSDDDLDFEHMRDDPFLARFDVLFPHFNSAATYSGPAVLRLLHGTCGQTPQRELYSGTAPDACYLFRNLAAAGYRPALLLNHDGHFDNFAQQLRMQGGIGADPDDNRSAPVAMTSFDGTPIRSDFDLLAQWWKQHVSGVPNPDAHTALLYNTITLHDGNRVPGMTGMTSLQTYAPRLHRLFGDLGRFLDLIEASGRPTVVVLIPEHGAALRGDAVQVAGLREIPTPAITTVPAAVKLIGFPGIRKANSGPGAAPLTVDAPSSYLALLTLVAGLTQSGPVNETTQNLQMLLLALPSSEWIAENDGTVFFRHAGRQYLRSQSGQWNEFGNPG
jgi:cellulose synthase operon protein YhjU